MKKTLRVLEELYKLVSSLLDRSNKQSSDIQQLQEGILLLGSKLKHLEEKQNVTYDKKMH